jgi:signal peptidase I
VKKLTKEIIQTLKQTLIEFLTLTFISAGVIVLVFWLVGQPLEISGDSMLPTIKDGEQIIVEKLTIKSTLPQRGEVLIVRHPQNDSVFIIKRVIGLPGEKIKIEDDSVFINDEKLDEPYLQAGIKTIGRSFLGDNTEYMIPQKNYMVLGDNREDSADSRNWGTIELNKIVGRPVFVYYPWKNFRMLENL